jgi:TolB protein
MAAPLPALEPVVAPRAPRRRGRLAVLLLVPLLAAGALWVASRQATPNPSVLPARIAVVNPDGSMSVLDGAGTSVARYDLPGVTFQFPAWSPDGSRIAVIGGDVSRSGVYVLTRDGSPGGDPIIYESADQRPFYLSWSPDGERVTFLTNEPDGIALRVAPADAGSPAEIVRRGSPLYWDWVDPARLLVHTGGDGPNAFVGEVDLGGTTLDDSGARPGFFRAPGVSHAGTHRAYIAPGTGGPNSGTEATEQAIVVEARDGSGRHEIPVEGSVAFTFDPTASTLAFIASDRPTTEPPPFPIGPLRTVDAGTGAVRTLLDGLVIAFFWAPDAQTIAALEFLDQDDPDVDEARDGRPRVAMAGPAAQPAFAVSAAAQPPGLAVRLRFIDVATGTTRSERVIRVSELFVFQLLPYFDQYALSHRLWSPDSASILLPIASDRDPDRVVILPADGSDPRPLADGSMAFWSP